MAPVLSRLEGLPFDIRTMILKELLDPWFKSIDLIVAGTKRPNQVWMPIGALHLARASPIFAAEASESVLSKRNRIATQYEEDFIAFNHSTTRKLDEAETRMISQGRYKNTIMALEILREDLTKICQERDRLLAARKMLTHTNKLRIPFQEAENGFQVVEHLGMTPGIAFGYCERRSSASHRRTTSHESPRLSPITGRIASRDSAF